MTDYDLSDGDLTVDGTPIETPYPVADALVAEGIVVARIKVPKGVEYPRNVWGIDPDGTVRWKVERPEPRHWTEHPYTNIGCDYGELWAYNWNSMAYTLDPETGERLGGSFRK